MPAPNSFPRNKQKQQQLVVPINMIFGGMQSKSIVKIWLVDAPRDRIEGRIQAFDEFMNMTLEDAVEVRVSARGREEKRRNLGEIVLKGDNVSLIAFGN
ncbi:small nuclear ribonucleoprotein SmE [Penicillium argentinense]|uniref:Small nuclear ribonucleoprotein E n=1 Tax=Penicillium argentinense TaxID=1131581 RepID=A0A9W9K783_9EURO|nr:small nuclear ribonucleoprotein SmE [Penicillium argentinense]KAJ5095056.1 small nuclear ribonucleoprotein SmE [Penicillium argentinense]